MLEHGPFAVMAGAPWNVLDSRGSRIALCGGDSNADWERCGPPIAAAIVEALNQAASDDRGPVTDDWLKSIGFHSSWDQGYLSKRYCISIAPLWHWPACGDLKPLWQIGFANRATGTAEFEAIPTPETRGDVRRLAKALGIQIAQCPITTVRA